MIEPRSTKRAIGEGLLWTTAGLLIATVHAGAVAVLLREPEMVVADSGPPPAIMIELAAESEAVITEENEISTEQVDAEEVKTATSEPLPEPVPEPVEQPLPEPPPPEPEPEVAEALPEPPPVIEPLPEPAPEIDPIEQMVMAELENVEVPIPMMRPPVPKPPVEKKKEPAPKKVVKKQVQPPASQAARTAKAEVAQSTRNAASATANGSGRSVSPQKWLSRVHAHILRRKKSMSRLESDALVTVKFTFDSSGNILSVSANSSSGNAALTEAAISMVRRSSPIPAPPTGQTYLTVPIKFEARR